MKARSDAERTAYYREQASACARAAAATAIAEARQAYLELEQGWLCLAPRPKVDAEGVQPLPPGHAGDATAAAGARSS